MEEHGQDEEKVLQKFSIPESNFLRTPSNGVNEWVVGENNEY